MAETIVVLEQNPWFFYAVLFITGACVGSFLNVVILRLPPVLFWQWRTQSRAILELPEDHADPKPADLIKPRSKCPSCNNVLKPLHNIPVIGYLLLSGKCGYCQNAISIRYLIIETLTAFIWLQLGIHFGPTPVLIFSLILLSGFIALAFIDLDHQLLPDVIVLPLLWLGFLVNTYDLLTDLHSSVIGAIAGYMMLWTIYQVHHRLTGKEGMGYGDFKLLACIGAWLGWQYLPIVILIASVSGTFFALSMMVWKKQSKDVAVAFGPYLIIAGWISLIWGETIMSRYLQIFQV